MEKIGVLFNRLTNTLDVWFDDPGKECISEETGEGIILKKNKIHIKMSQGGIH